jgi:hypothetical protein
MPHAPTAILAALLAALSCTPATAQDDGSPSSPPPANDPQPDAQPVTEPRMHPGVLLGRRASSTLAARGVIPTVVLVPDPASYAEAIARWTPEAIFPVLIDDGTTTAREDIARFVRGFQPEAVVGWNAAPMRPRRAIPTARQLANDALERAWDFELDLGTTDNPAVAPLANQAPALITHWMQLRLAPPGVVVADERDPAWTAALALAAARGQPILWTTLPKLSVDSSLTPAEIDPLCTEIEQFCARARLPWQKLGDVIDAITVCAALPVRIETAPKEYAATTDRLGRHPDARRWAWAGQVFGSEPCAAYRAMCSVFLTIDSAWLFDGYGSTQPWLEWDCTAASGYLKQADIFVMLDDEPTNQLRDWKLRAERPVHADLILINSSGNRAWFDLSGSRARSGDIPLLDVPAAMHMVHSWSAVAPGRPATVAGRWLEHGVFAYIGSVHEPYLQAFVPTPLLARRLVAGAAFGAAGRLDSGPLWRITVLGDPLFAYRPPVPRLAAELPLDGAVSIEDSLQTAVSAGQYAELYATLGLLGRDSDTAKLFAAMLRDKPEELDAPVAAAALFALFRTGQDDEFLRAFAALSADAANDLSAIDALWHVGRRAVRERSTYREAALTLMAAHIRETQQQQDAAELMQLGGGRP